jgi:hypothetical protein
MIVLKPVGAARAALVAATAVAAAALAYAIWNGGAMRPLDRAVSLAAGLALAVGAIEGLQRRYEIRSREVRLRHLFFWWRIWRLPEDLRMHSDRRGRLLLTSDSGWRLALPSHYNRLGELEKRIWHLREFLDPVRRRRLEATELEIHEPVGVASGKG